MPASNLYPYIVGQSLSLAFFKAGLSCQLAYLAKKFDRPLILTDISQEFIEDTKQHLLQHGFQKDLHFVLGTIKDLFLKFPFAKKPPCFFVVDADHTYKGARFDLCNILHYTPNIPVIGFHDYGVESDESMQMERSNNADMIVYGIDDAILDVIGDETALHPVGEIGEKVRKYGNDGFNYLIEGQPEGVLLFPKMIDRVSFITANSFMACVLAGNKDLPPENISPLDAEIMYALKHSRWIKLGRKLELLKSLDVLKL